MMHTRSDDLLVAISYAAADEPVARAAMARLEARGLTAALTVESPVDAALLLVVLSSASDAASGQLAHLHAAHAARCPMLGLRIAPVPISPALASQLERSTIIDAFALSLDEHLDQLAALLDEAFANRPQEG